MDKCTAEYEREIGSSLLQGFSQQSQLLEMSVDPEGDGLTQDHSSHLHSKNHMYTKYTTSKPLTKRLQSTLHPRGKSKKLPPKQPAFSAHFRLGWTGEGSAENAQKTMMRQQPNDQSTALGAASRFHANQPLTISAQPDLESTNDMDQSPSTPLPSGAEELAAKVENILTTDLGSKPSSEFEDNELLDHGKTQGESTVPAASLQLSTASSKKAETWIESQDGKMQAAVSLAKALLSLQVTPPDFIDQSKESANEQATTMPRQISTTTPSANTKIVSHPDAATISAQNATSQGRSTWHALLETFHSQMHNSFACLLVAIINGPMQTLAILLLLFLGHTLRKEVMELKASNAELMQKVYDATTSPSTPTYPRDRRFFGRSDSRADWQRAIQVVGGRE